MFAWNMVLALAWAALHGEFSLTSLSVGFAVGYLLLALLVRGGLVGQSPYTARASRAAGFIAFFLWELVLANIRIAHDVLTPKHHMQPGIVAIPLDAKTDAEITLLANLITLTPGTLSLDVSEDRRVLYIHAMYIPNGDTDALRADVKNGFERRLLETLR
ncbi:MAG: cation:proton antiporter [Armatimonadota bacterium]|nr:MAG: cation:proton antiporter [Armatimonadota bacterium]